MKIKYILNAACILIIGAIAAGAAYAEDDSVPLLKKYINEGRYADFHNTLVQTGLSFSSKTESSEEFSEFLINLWDENAASDPGLAWKTANTDLYRASVAGVMVVGAKDGWFVYDMDPVYAYLRNNVRNPDISTTALVYLGIAGQKSDIPLFADLAESMDSNVYRPAISALRTASGAQARATLVELANKTSDPEKKAFIHEVLRKTSP